MEKDKKYYTYILLTQKGTLYCGYTDDVEKRFHAHVNGKGAKYTKTFKPEKIVYVKEFKTKSEAQKHESMIKKLKRSDKTKIIAENKLSQQYKNLQNLTL